MRKTEPQTDIDSDIRFPGWRRPVALVLALFLCLAFTSGCREDDGATRVPTGSTETSCPTEEIPSTETALSTETAAPTESTQVPQPPETTVSPTENTVPPTEVTSPPTQSTEPTAPPTEPTQDTEPAPSETQPPMQIQIGPDRTEVLLIPKKAKAFVSRDLTQPVEWDIYNYKTVQQRLDTSQPVSLFVKVTNMPQGVSITSIVFELADNGALIGGREYRPVGDQRYVHVHYLLADKQYFYRVSISFSDGTTRVLESNFRTAAAPRLLSIDGIVNVRDIGGWKTLDGSVIRQGLLYRGSELDGAKMPEYKLTEEGLRQMREELGIRTDMDLRSQSELSKLTNPLGEDIPHIFYDARQYTAAFRQPGREAVRKIFADLAEPDNYPVYLHCTYGADRTGTICFLLEALLGVSEEDLQREYELTTMYHTWVDSEGYRNMVAELKTWEGDTLQEKAEAFLLHCGVTSQQIAQIRDIFLEKQ